MTAGVKISATASSTTCTANSSVKMRVGEQPRRIRPALLADAGIGRHERRIEGALGEDRAEMIGQPQRHKKGVGDRARAKNGRQHDVAHKAGDARKQREAADGEDATDHGTPLRTQGNRESHLS